MKLNTVKLISGYLLFQLVWFAVSRGLEFAFQNKNNGAIIELFVAAWPYCFFLINSLLIYKLIIFNNKTVTQKELDFENLYTANPNPLWIYDPETLKFLSVNDAAIATYGYSRKEFLQLTTKDIGLIEDNDKLRETSERNKGSQYSSGVWRHLRKDGTLLYVNVTSAKISFNNKQAVKVIVTDTTAQVRYEQELKLVNQQLSEEKQKLKETETLARVSGWEYYLNDRLLVWSDELYEIFELDRKDDRNKYEQLLKTVYHEDLPNFNKSIENLLKHGQDLDLVYRFVSKTNQLKYVKILGKICYSEGEMFKAQGIMQDITELRLMQMEKNSYLQRLSNTLENINDAYCLLNRNWIFTDVNLNCGRLLNLKKEAIINHHYLELFPEAGKWKFYSSYKKVLEEGVFINFEEYYYPAKRWFCINAYPTDEGAAIYFTDITETKHKDLQLKEALERYDLVAKATRDVIYDYDVLNKSITYSDNISEFLCLHKENIRSDISWWRSKIHPDDVDKVIEDYQHIIKNKQENCRAEYRVNTGDNKFKYIYDQGYLLYNEEGKYVRMIGAIKDVDRLKQIDEENKRLANIITKVNNMIIVQDVNNRITWVNKAFETFTGYTLNEVCGVLPQDILSGPETRISNTLEIIGAKQSLKQFSHEVINYKKDKQKYWVKIEFTPLFTAEGKPDGYISIHNDITLQKEKEARISQQNEILRNIAWMSSHELRRPVASILGLVGLITDSTDEEEKNQSIAMMKSCTEYLDEIIHKINYKIEQEISVE